MTDEIKRGPGRPAKQDLPEGLVRIRVLPLGDGKVSDGKGAGKGEDGFLKFSRCKRGDELVVGKDVGMALEAKGFAEVL